MKILDNHVIAQTAQINTLNGDLLDITLVKPSTLDDFTSVLTEKVKSGIKYLRVLTDYNGNDLIELLSTFNSLKVLHVLSIEFGAEFSDATLDYMASLSEANVGVYVNTRSKKHRKISLRHCLQETVGSTKSTDFGLDTVLYSENLILYWDFFFNDLGIHQKNNVNLDLPIDLIRFVKCLELTHNVATFNDPKGLLMKTQITSLNFKGNVKDFDINLVDKQRITEVTICPDNFSDPIAALASLPNLKTVYFHCNFHEPDTVNIFKSVKFKSLNVELVILPDLQYSFDSWKESHDTYTLEQFDTLVTQGDVNELVN